jgi:SAM-dependent methyltransferase
MMEYANQRQYWDNLHAAGKHDAYTHAPSAFAQEIIALVPPRASVIELGCGAGADAALFARQGHSVVALDFSGIAIARNVERYKELANLTFQVADLSQPLAFQDGALDLVYARLSLHYFPDAATRQIIAEIHRVLKPGGLLTFMCKSTDDPLYGQGTKLEHNMFDYDGHVRHFFSEDYTRSCLASGYEVEQIESRTGDLFGKPSAYVVVIAWTTPRMA